MKKTTLLILLLIPLFSITGFTKTAFKKRANVLSISALAKDKEFINFYKASLKYVSKVDLISLKTVLTSKYPMSVLSIDDKNQIAKAYGFNSYDQFLKIKLKLHKMKELIVKKYPELITNDSRELVHEALREDVKNGIFAFNKITTTKSFYCEEYFTELFNYCSFNFTTGDEFLSCVDWANTVYLNCLLFGGDGNPI